MSRFSGRQLFLGFVLIILYTGLFLLGGWLEKEFGVQYAILLISGILVLNLLYTILYFVNEFQYDRVISGRASMETAERIQRYRGYFAWYWVALVNCSQLFVFAFLFQYFYLFGGDKFFVFKGELHYFDWVLFTLDCTFKSIFDIPEIFDIHLRNIRHVGLVGGLIVMLVRTIIYSMLIAALLRQWNKWRMIRETFGAMNTAPRMAGRRLIRLGEEALPMLDQALLKKELFKPELGEKDHLLYDQHSEPLVRMLIRNLTVGDEAERRNAAVLFGLIALRDNSTFPYYQKLFVLARREPVPEIRAEIIRSLGLLRERRILPNIRRFLSDPEPVVRVQVIRALGHMKDHHSIHVIAERLKDGNEDVREVAARALGQIGSKGAIPLLQKAMQYEDEAVHRETIFSLAHLNDRSVGGALLNMLKDDEPHIRLKTLDGAQSLQPDGAFEAITELLEDSEAEIRNRATEVLAELDRERAANLLLEQPSDPEPLVRRTRIAVIRECRDERFVAALCEAMYDKDPRVRERAIDAMGAYGSQEAVDALLKLLQDAKAPEDKVCATRSLGFSGHLSAYEPLHDLAKSSQDLHLRRQAIRSLVRLDPNRAREALLPLMEDKNVRNEAAFTLVGMREERAIPGLISMLGTVSEPKLKEVIWDGLRQVSRQNLPMDHKAWKKWYQEAHPEPEPEPEQIQDI